jgi:hypothetical protein
MKVATNCLIELGQDGAAAAWLPSASPILIRWRLGRVLIFRPLPFREGFGGQLVRECRDHRPTGVAEPYREHSAVRDHNICTHALNMAPSVPACTPSQMGILIPAYFTERRSNCTGDPS